MSFRFPASPDRVGAGLYAIAAAIHTAWLVAWSAPPASTRLDANNYLELALQLWRTGDYGSRVGTDYPPLYSMVISPVFSLASNDLRFGVLLGLHGVFLSLGLLALHPMLRSALGARRSWVALAAAQFLAGLTYHGLATRSEVLFTALVCGVVGAVWGAFASPTGRRWVLVGALCGLAVTCRRLGVVLPLAVAAVVILEALPRRAAGRAARRMAWLGLGLAVGLLPEVLASILHGDAIETYHPGVVGSHLSPLADMWTRLDRLGLAASTLARQTTYGVVAFVGAPVVLAAVLTRRDPRLRPPAPLAAAAGVALLCSLGFAALSSLHILRYAYGRPDATPFHLYPRYLDPAEPVVILCAVAAASVVAGQAVDPSDRARVRRLVPSWILPCALLAAACGGVWRIRGGRLAPAWYFEGTPLEVAYPFVFVGAALLMLAALTAWWSLGRYGTVWTVVGAVALGWAMSLHVLLKPERWGGTPKARWSILQAPVFESDAPLPVAVPLRRSAESPRELYLPAFRTEHDVYWPRVREMPRWLHDHPTGVVMTRVGEPSPPREWGLALVAGSSDWRVWVRRNTGPARGPVWVAPRPEE